MSNQKTVKTSLNEDFEALGLPSALAESQHLLGIKPQEEGCGNQKGKGGDAGDGEDDEDDMEEGKDKNVAKGEKVEGEEAPAAPEVTESDLYDGEFVTAELFERIEALSFDEMDESDFEELLSKLSEKKIPEGNDELREQAEKLIEGVGTRIRRFKAGKVSKKMSFQCPEGQRATGVGHQCQPSHVVAGGMGNINKEAREKKKWGRGGKGFMSKLHSKRVNKRRGNANESLLSPLAQDLLQVTESTAPKAVTTVREEIIERVVSIMTFLNEEFMDKSVAEIYEGSINEMIDTYEAGRLDEDVMNEDEFIAEMEPVLSLITKSIDRLEDSEDLGNG